MAAIIDDDRSLLDSLSRIIDAAEGFRCAGAFPSVEEALPALRTAGADVLLLDIQLPGVQGDQAIESLRAASPAMRVLMLTVFSSRWRRMWPSRHPHRSGSRSSARAQVSRVCI
jgi:DNA-binding NarL/FixJ family response regulator